MKKKAEHSHTNSQAGNQVKDAVKVDNVGPESVNDSTADSPQKTLDSSTNTASAKQNRSQSESKSKTVEKKPRHAGITLFLLVLCSTGIAMAGYDFWLLQKQAAVNAQQANTQASNETHINQLETNLKNTQGQLALEVQARQRIEAENQALNTAMQRVLEKLGRSTIAWRMAEVEYLLTVANHRLALAQDRRTAIAVFETADSRLKAMGDPSLLPVRKLIANELIALRSVPEVDIPGLALEVGSLAESVASLELLDKKRLAVASQKPTDHSSLGWRELPLAIWQDLKSLVQVRRHEQPTEPLLPPGQAWFLYQNLALKLEQARLAILQHNTALFRQSLDEASLWVGHYFDEESSSVKNFQETISRLRGIELQPPLPDVSKSLQELRSLMRNHSNEMIGTPGKTNSGNKTGSVTPATDTKGKTSQ